MLHGGGTVSRNVGAPHVVNEKERTFPPTSIRPCSQQVFYNGFDRGLTSPKKVRRANVGPRDRPHV